MKLYNTLTKKKEEFVPMKQGKVGLYTCGPTVYDYAHIGNLRTYIFEDILKRALIHAGYDVTHIMNITDVGHLTSDADEGEDKMEKGARREKKTVWEIAEFYADEFKKNISDLNILPPDKWVKATEHIKEQINLVKKLEKNGLTYKTSDGIYFDTAKFPQYADFAGLKLQQQKEGARVEQNDEKHNASDFALWKFSPKDQKRAMEWDSPWGVGFPGWHIECSAMSMACLGDTFDIHAGGVDHIPVHHTNEVAQAQGATGKPLARFWLHGEFLIMKNDQKMAKSEGNFVTLQSLIDKAFDPLAYRYFVMGAHYRSKLSFSWEALEGAQITLRKLRAIVRKWGAPKGSCADIEQEFFASVDDDLNMPKALATMWELVKSDNPKGAKRASINKFDTILGLGLADLKPIKIPKEVQELVDQRETERADKHFDEADALREKIEKKGFVVDDTPEGPLVSKV